AIHKGITKVVYRSLTANSNPSQYRPKPTSNADPRPNKMKESNKILDSSVNLQLYFLRKNITEKRTPIPEASATTNDDCHNKDPIVMAEKTNIFPAVSNRIANVPALKTTSSAAGRAALVDNP